MAATRSEHIVCVSKEQYDRLMQDDADEAPAALRRLVLEVRYPKLTRLFAAPSVFEADNQ